MVPIRIILVVGVLTRLLDSGLGVSALCLYR